MNFGSRPAKSAHVVTASGNSKYFSTRDDFIGWLISQGRIDDEDGLAEAGGEWIDMFHTWVQQGATGCIFAQRRARAPEESQWLGVVLNTPPETRDLNGLQKLLKAASDPQAIVLAFPSATTLDDIESIVEKFHAHPSWECEIVRRKDDVENDGFLEVGIRWLVPDTRYRSEVLGFGPIPEFPVTRQAPVTAMAFRTHPPLVREPDGRVHLAQMPFDALENQRRERLWERTQVQRADLLAGNLDHVAKAKVTFRLPQSPLTDAMRN